MAKGTKVLPEEERQIIEALTAGMSTRQAAKKFNRAKSTIIDVAKRNGFDFGDRSESKKAAIAKSCYASADRIKLIGKALDKIDLLLDTVDTPKDLQSLMVALGIGIDKRRLEDEDLGEGKGGEISKLFDKMEADGL